jgi:predicted DNA-binding transcriptional regulator AlpA
LFVIYAREKNIDKIIEIMIRFQMGKLMGTVEVDFMTEINSESPTTCNTKEVLSLVRCGATKLYCWLKEGKFPKPMRFGRQNRWFKSDIINFINNGFKLTPDL